MILHPVYEPADWHAMDVYRALIASTRVGESTRHTLARRAAVLTGSATRSLLDTSYATLDAVTRRLIPQATGDAFGDAFVDIAAGIDASFLNGTGDGWRYADLPPDRESFVTGLQWIESLAEDRHGVSFVALDPAAQDRLIDDILSGRAICSDLNARHWCEDLLAAAAVIFVSHPATLARIGFSGIAFRPQWPTVGLGATQPWEPVAR